MFVKLLRGPQPANILLIFLFSSLLWLKFFWTYNFDNQEFFVPFIKAEYLRIPGQQLLNALILFAIIVFEAFYMVRLNFRYIFIDQRTYFPAMVYMLWMTIMAGTSHYSATVIANLFVIIAFEGLLKVSFSKLDMKLIFKSGLLIGVASFFYWPVFLVIVPFWFITLILHGINWRGLFAQFTGALTPWVFLFAYYYLIDKAGIWQYFVDTLKSERLISLDLGYSSIRLYVIIFLLFISLLHYFTHVIDKKIIIRKYFSGLFWFLFVITCGMLLIPSAGQAGVVLAALPATVFLSNQYLTNRNVFFTELFFLLLLSATVLWVVFS